MTSVALFKRYARDAIQQAFYALRDNRLRTTLSILGVAFGIASVMAVSTVSQSGRHYVFSELQTYGLKTIWVYRKFEQDNPYAAFRQGSGIDNDDVRAILASGCCPAVKRVSPVVYSSDWEVRVRVGGVYRKVAIEGVGLDYLDISNDTVVNGRGFREDDIGERRAVAIIGPKVHSTLFGTHTDPVGKTLRMNNLKLTVIGVLQEKSRKFLSTIGAENYDINDRILIPYTLYQQLLGSKDVHTLQAEAVDLASSELALKQVVDTLYRSHNDKFEYTQESMRGWIDTANRILWSISLIGLVGALVSLFIGGLGIMNIMSTSVVERTREIGIRKAIGARNGDILAQFLFEAVFISGIGGLLGLVMGGIASYGLALWTGLPLQPSWLMVAVAFVVSLLVGVLSGYYPARYAAALRPVDALRYE